MEPKIFICDCHNLEHQIAFWYDEDIKRLFNLTRKKLEINKLRKWGKPDKNGVVEHMKK